GVPDECDLLSPLTATGLGFVQIPAHGPLGYMPIMDWFFKVDPDSAFMNRIGRMWTNNLYAKDIAVDPTDGMLYTVDLPVLDLHEMMTLVQQRNDNGPEVGSRIYTVDPDTGESTPLPEITGHGLMLFGLTFTADGELWADGLFVGQEVQPVIVLIDKTTGEEVDHDVVGEFGFAMATEPGSGQVYSLAIDMVEQLGDLSEVLLGTNETPVEVLCQHEVGDPTVFDCELVTDPEYEDVFGYGRIVLDIAFGDDGTLYGVAIVPFCMGGGQTLAPMGMFGTYLVVIDPETAAITETVGMDDELLWGLGGQLPATSQDADGDEIPDECQGEPLECGAFDVVFVVDTSGSIQDEGQALCGNIKQIIGDLKDAGLPVTATLLGVVENPPASSFDCLTGSVLGMFGPAVPGVPPACCPLMDKNEDWAAATAIVSQNFPWMPGAARVVIPISDEGPEGGDPCQDPGPDRAGIANAANVANANNVFVAPIMGNGTTACVMALAQELGSRTGGQAFRSDDPQEDIVDAVTKILINICVLGGGDKEVIDLCPDDPEKIEPGICGCGIPDLDLDGDGVLECDREDVGPPEQEVPPACGACGAGGAAAATLGLWSVLGLKLSRRRRR
ncbi:MAG: hypothetical protein JSU68_08370, partial [Phycisphaerales bacterium]